MDLKELFEDKSVKAKAKVAQIGQWLLNGELPVEELLAFIEMQKAVNKATCIEAIEYATKKSPGIAGESVWVFVTGALKDNEPRVKWESAKVMGNIAGLFPEAIADAIPHLLANATHQGTVVRWAAAYALAEILKLKTEQNKELIPKIEVLSDKEEDNGVKKKYIDALKKAKK